MSDLVPDSSPRSDDLTAIIKAARASTPARVLVGRAGSSYRTSTQLELLADHAAAVDAVRTEFNPVRDLGAEFLEHWGLFEVATMAHDREAYLRRPDLGRRLGDQALEEIRRRCPAGADIQVVIGDGLSATAVASQVPSLLPALAEGAQALGWRLGQPFLIRNCRVGVMNDIGEALDAGVIVLLIGERPGLATAESLSAYLAYRPRTGNTDANRNLISNIHSRGTPPLDAAPRVLALAGQMIRLGTSGVAISEGWDGPSSLPASASSH